jgi:hypothetical protein
LDTIHTGFLLKSIESSDIEFNEQRIMQIKTLKWNENIRKYELQIQNRSQKPSRKSTIEKASKNSFIIHWTKFLHHIIKDKSHADKDDIPTDVSVMTDDLTDNTSISLSSFTDS